MPITWESIYSFFSPPASRNSSPQGTPSLLASAFSPQNAETTSTKQTDLPMPPTSAFTAAAVAGAAPIPSPADSSTSLAASERDYFPPTSPYTHRSPSMSSTSTASTVPSELQQQLRQHHPQRTQTTPAVPHTTTTTVITPSNTEIETRPPPPRRSATEVGPLDPLSRTFPKPAHEPSLDELLARKPGKWSLSHYVRNAGERKVAATSDEERARQFEEAKARLLRAKVEIDGRAGAVGTS